MSIDFKKLFSIVKVPVILLTALTCVGILINFINSLVLIGLYWAIVLGLCAICSVWSGYNAAKNNFSSGLAGAATWIVPGTIGLTIGGINAFLSALLWGALERYEAIAFIVGAIVIVVALAIGAVISFGLGTIGGWLGTRSVPSKKKK